MILISTPKGGKICKEMYGDMEFGVPIETMNDISTINKIEYLLQNENKVRDKLAIQSKRMAERSYVAGQILKKFI
jgi:hypothetical protein